MFVIEKESRDLVALNEIFIRALDTLPSDIENSMIYPKLRSLLHPEILRFTRDFLDLRNDLDILRENIGQTMSEEEIREYLDGLKQKYNMEKHNVGIDYHIEVTRFDYGVPVFVVIKRDIIYIKKFVFRFRKGHPSDSLKGLDPAGIPISESEESSVDKLTEFLKNRGEKDEI